MNNVPDLSQIGTQRKYHELFGYDTVDMLPTEITQVKELIVWAKRQLENYELTIKSLNEWAIMVDHKFQEIGWQVIVDPFDVALDNDGKGILTPQILVTGRVTDQEFDFERAKAETQSGLLDGKPGRVNEKGVWLDN